MGEEKKEKKKIGMKILLIGVVILLLLQLWKMDQKLERLDARIQQIDQNMQNLEQGIPALLRNQSHKIEELMKKEESLLLESSVGAKLIGNKLEVTVKAEPKVKQTGESLIAQVVADGRVYEKELDVQNQAILMIDLAKELKTTILFRSEEGVKQEVLQTLYDTGYLMGELSSNWEYVTEEEKEKIFLRTWAVNGEEMVSLTEEDIAEATFIITAEKTEADGAGDTLAKAMEVEVPEGEMTKEFLEQLEGERIPAKMMTDNGMYRFGFELDFTEYAAREESVEYSIYLVFTTKDGVTFASLKPIAFYQCYESGRQGEAYTTASGSGDGWFRAVF